MVFHLSYGTIDIKQVVAEGEIPQEYQPSKADMIRWALTVEQMSREYTQQKAAIVKLALFFAKHDDYKWLWLKP